MTASIMPSSTRSAIMPAKFFAAAEQHRITPQKKTFTPRTLVTGKRWRRIPTMVILGYSGVNEKEHTLWYLSHGVCNEKTSGQPGEVVPAHA